MATAKTTTKKTARKKTTARTSPAKKTTAKRTRTRTPKKPPLTEREPRVVLEDAGYAIAGVASDVVDFAKVLPSKLQGYRGQVVKTADAAPERVRTLAEEAPDKVRTTVIDLRDRVSKDVDGWVKSFEKNFDAKAAEGRKLAEQVKNDQRVQRVLDQTGATRSQVKGAVTSVAKTADVAVEAGRKAGKNQAESAATQVKGAVSSVAKTADVAVEAGRKAGKKQAETAATQVKGAATSIRTSAATVADAAETRDS
jgi:hypothetical protein